ncbi:MAG: PAS domain-containing protein [Deltaproteobacteria bacterium]|nr:MAG: PAS domain-containing protein [Deltaproteobacteria bacterium]
MTAPAHPPSSGASSPDRGGDGRATQRGPDRGGHDRVTQRGDDGRGRDGVERRDGTDLARRVTYLMLFRLVLISFALGTTVVIAWVGDVDLQTPNTYILLAIIAATYLLTIAYAIALPRVANMTRFATAQIAVDLVIATLLVHVTGGAQSGYTFFFPVAIVGAATVRYQRGAIATAAASAFLFVAVSILGWTGALPSLAGQRLLPSDLSALELARHLGLNLAAFGAIAVLAVNLGGQLARASASLETERAAAADLYTLHEDIVRCLTSGLVTVDTSGTVLTANRAAVDLLELDCDPVGRPLADVAPALAEAVTAADPHAPLRRGEVDIRLPSGRRAVFGVSLSPLVDHQNRPRGRILSFQDLTELRAMEAQVRQAERLATIGTVAASVAHELRNPLASISGSIELLRSDRGSSEDRTKLMEIVTREVDRLDRLIRDLLDYTNPRPRHNVAFALDELVEETLRVFARDPDLGSVPVRLTRTTDEPIAIEADAEKLRQVLWNLLRNAAEAAGATGGRVDLRVGREGDHAVVCVADDGPGMPPEVVAHMFDPFFTTRAGGTGLGLAIVRHIVDEHGGAIDVDSAPGRGTRITVRVPAGPAAAAGPPTV